jgi:acetyl esterase/lipase
MTNSPRALLQRRLPLSCSARDESFPSRVCSFFPQHVAIESTNGSLTAVATHNHHRTAGPRARLAVVGDSHGGRLAAMKSQLRAKLEAEARKQVTQ